MDLSKLEKIPNRDSWKFTKFPKSSLILVPPELPKPPEENLLQVHMGGAHLLLPNTLEYDQFEGVETGALASCSGIALYIPHENDAILGVAHLAPSQGAVHAIQQFNRLLLEAGLDRTVLYQESGFLSFIEGQATYDRGKSLLRDDALQKLEYFQRQFPKLKGFPNNKVSYSVLRGHVSSRVKLFKDGKLVISGEGKNY